MSPRIPPLARKGLLRRAGRTRNIATWARRLHDVFGGEQLRQFPYVELASAGHPQGCPRTPTVSRPSRYAVASGEP